MNNNSIQEMVKLKILMGNENSTFNTFIMLIIPFIELVFEFVKNFVYKYFDDKKTKLLERTKITPANEKYSIFLEKDLQKSKNNEILESVLYNISNKYSIKSVTQYKDIYIVNFFDQFLIEDSIYGKLHTIEYDSDKNVSLIKLQISSDSLKVNELKDYVNKCYIEYKRTIQNNLGNDLYYFDQCYDNTNNNKNMYKLNNDIINDDLTFEINKFTSSKNFSNIFGKELDTIKKRVAFFLNNKQWYIEKGLPHTLGLLLHGLPGCGKTSCVKAIANECKRHIVNINFNLVKTNTQLKNIFYKEQIHCEKNGIPVIYDIPVNERIYVLEDIDCMNDIVLDRSFLKSSSIIEQTEGSAQQGDFEFKDKVNEKIIEYTFEQEHGFDKKSVPQNVIDYIKNNEIYKHKNWNMIKINLWTVKNVEDLTKYLKEDLQAYEEKENTNLVIETTVKPINKKGDDKKEDEIKDPITLSSLLNILDGILEIPGRLIIITSNYPERLDKALIRPGRIDLIQKLGKCELNTIKEMYESFYSTTLTKELDETLNKKWSPAELNCLLFNNFDTPDKFLTDIIETKPSFLTSF